LENEDEVKKMASLKSKEEILQEFQLPSETFDELVP